MTTTPRITLRLRAATVALIALGAFGLTGCSGEVTPVEKAEALVESKEKAVAEAQSDFVAASAQFCDASKTYIEALDRYGDILNSTAVTVSDVTTAGADLAKPSDNAFDDADAAIEANEALVVAQQELADAQFALAEAQAVAASTAPPAEPAPLPEAAPLVPAADVERVKQATTEFDTAQSAITPDTPLTTASEQFNAAVVALEFSWLRLFADAGCLTDEQQVAAAATVSAYTAALQTDLTTAGYYAGAVDGVYGPATVAAVEALQTASGLPVTGTVDKATADALQAALFGTAGAAAQESVASTAAVQQTLKLVGLWDGPVDGVWSPELTDAVKAFQTELGVEPTGVVDAATVSAFQQALAALTAPDPEPSEEPSETEAP